MTFLRSLLRDTYVIITDLYCQGINNASLAPEQRRNKTVEHPHQTVTLSLLAGFSGFWMCLFCDMKEAPVAALGCGQTIIFFTIFWRVCNEKQVTYSAGKVLLSLSLFLCCQNEPFSRWSRAVMIGNRTVHVNTKSERWKDNKFPSLL